MAKLNWFKKRSLLAELKREEKEKQKIDKALDLMMSDSSSGWSRKERKLYEEMIRDDNNAN